MSKTSSTQNRCTTCGQPAPHGVICEEHLDALLADLDTVAGLARELDAAMSRQIGRGPRTGSRSAETALPVDLRITPVRHHLHNVLRYWASEAWEHGARSSIPLDVMDPAAVATWLYQQPLTLRRLPDVTRMAAQVTTELDSLQLVLEVTVDTTFVGPCEAILDTTKKPCGTLLYAVEGSDTIECPRCQTRYEVEEHRDYLRSRVDDHVATAVEISRLCRRMLGEDVSPKMIYGYAERGMITPHGQLTTLDIKGRRITSATYRIGDVRDAVGKARGDRKLRNAIRRSAGRSA